MADRQPREWLLEVCRECGRIAQWPFCQHRQEWLDAYPRVMASTPSWTEHVRVREVGRKRGKVEDDRGETHDDVHENAKRE